MTNNRTFHLSDKDKKTLLKWGHPEKELKQIEDATNAGTFQTKKGACIGWLTAKRLVGTENFLSGIARASFHWTATRDSAVCGFVYFNFSNYFKD